MHLPPPLHRAFEKLKSQKHVDLLRYFYTFLGHDLPSWPHLISEEQLGRWRNVLVLAPHPDDEAFGMGGTLVILERHGAALRFRWFTNGANPTRTAEALACMKTLGVTQTAAESLPLAGEAIVVQEATAVIEREMQATRFEAICVPSIFDAHPDHVRLGLALKRAIISQGWTGEVIQYEVWSTLVPNFMMEISSVMEEKARLMKGYVSQLGDPATDRTHYMERMTALNRYRGLAQHIPYAEGFVICPAGAFLKITGSADIIHTGPAAPGAAPASK